ncbi:E3 ubiquitin-protein ligase ubr1 [Bonamia ostreae]|uniref:E3 ubiquitin-protein ligase ubr1 n=1 Tax=Bonamia ostreae TaxID=126728 RepID=A0ABV2AQT3_9EUKA
MESHSLQNGVCARQFKEGEPAYRCTDCQKDSYCIQCLPCFRVFLPKNAKF